MYIEKIKINKFRVLEDIEVRFQGPDLSAVEEGRGNGNVVNVIAGVNGTGKTSLLDAIYDIYSKYDARSKEKLGAIRLGGLGGHSDVSVLSDAKDIDAFVRSLNVNTHDSWREGDNSYKKSPRMVFLPSYLSFKYSKVSEFPSKAWEASQKIDNNSILGNAEYYIKEYIYGESLVDHDSDPVRRIRNAVKKFNSVFLGTEMLTILEGLDSDRFNRPVFRNSSQKVITIDQLSDGEKQLYGRVISLMLLEPSNSIILIDEPEIALHPAWQQKIMQIYSRIGTNNQFIVATHSPQVIASVPYQNRILLRKEDGKIKPIHCHQPPSGVDVNSILTEIMGADLRPKEVLERYQRYRQLVEQKQENSEEAKKLRALLVNDESEHSRFMQEMAFHIELRDAA